MFLAYWSNDFVYFLLLALGSRESTQSVGKIPYQNIIRIFIQMLMRSSLWILLCVAQLQASPFYETWKIDQISWKFPLCYPVHKIGRIFKFYQPLQFYSQHSQMLFFYIFQYIVTRRVITGTKIGALPLLFLVVSCDSPKFRRRYILMYYSNRPK